MVVNITPIERIGRVAVGLAFIALGIALFSGSEMFGVRAVAVAAALFGLDMLVTGAIGFCPLYFKLGRKGLTSVPRQQL